MAVLASISTQISGRVTFEFTSADDLRRLLEVLDAGLRTNPLFNEDIQDIVDDIRTTLDNL